MRVGSGKAGPLVTDNGNFILDADFGVLQDAAALETKLRQVIGIVETGLFIGMTEKVFFGKIEQDEIYSKSKK